MTFRRPLPAPQGAAGSVLAANALLSLSAFGLVGLLGRAARLKTLLVAAPLLALAASLALWRLSALSAVSADGEVGLRKRHDLGLVGCPRSVQYLCGDYQWSL